MSSWWCGPTGERVRERTRALLAPLVFVRIGLCLIMLVRHDDLLRGIVQFEHHAWGPGPEFGAQSLPPRSPAFAYSLVPGLETILSQSDLLVRVRMGTAVLLLLGILPRLNAALLALVSTSLLFADSLRYLHHLFIIYVSLLWLSFPPPGETVSGPRRWLPSSVSLLRAQVLATYFFAGLAKCSAAWLSGSTLQAFLDAGFATGPWMEAGMALLGASGLAWAVCGIELCLPLLLFLPRTRPLGIGLAVLLHVGIHLTMLVSTFGATLLVLLGSFLPTSRERAPGVSSARERGSKGGIPARSRKLAGHRVFVWPGEVRLDREGIAALLLAALLPVGARALGTGVGSYSMFTKLVRYRLDISADGRPFPRHLLTAHLGRDAARIVTLANGHGIGEVNVEVLGRALPALAGLVCRLAPGAETTELLLETERIEGGQERSRRVSTRCN